MKSWSDRIIIVCRRVLISYLIHCRSISISCHVNFVNVCADKETTSDNLQSVAQNQALEPKRKASSVVWNYFGFTSDDVEQRVILCKLCRTTVSAPSSNTTNLYNHLKFNHRVQYEECLNVKKKAPSDARTATQTPITTSLFSASPYPAGSRRQIEITEAITHFIAKDMAPINTVCSAGFKKLINTLDKRYVIPSRNYFSQVALPSLYAKCRESIESDLQKIEFYSTTTDLWSSRTMEPYMSLTVHYIDDEFQLKSRCLQTSYFPQDHTGDAIAQGLKEMLAAWDLKEEQQVCVTTDNAANIVNAVSINKWSRLQCFGHRLHLAIEHALKDGRIDRALNVCKKVVGCFSYSWRRRRELSEAQKELKLPQHKLKTECPTRWGSKQAMIARVLEQQSAISCVLSADRKARHLVPTWQDVEVLEAVNNSLSPLAEFTDALSGEQYVSVSYVKPVLHLFNNKILAEKEGETELSKCIKKKILDYLNEKYDDPQTQELLDMASAIDPRFKLKYVNEDRVEAVKIRLRTEMASISTVMKPQPSVSVTVREEAEDQNAPALKKTKKTLGSFFKVVDEDHRPASSSLSSLQDVAITAELQSYLLSAAVDSEENPLFWWKEHAKQFPALSKLAQKYLCIPATSSPSERVFSTGGNIVTCLRASLKPESVDRLVFLAKNL